MSKFILGFAFRIISLFTELYRIDRPALSVYDVMGGGRGGGGGECRH